MPRVVFTANLQRHVDCPPVDVQATTVRAALEAVFELVPQARRYVLDDQGAVRRHVMVFVDSARVTDLGDAVGETSEVYVMQALSGG